jgi:hypothetical protein
MTADNAAAAAEIRLVVPSLRANKVAVAAG